MFFLVVCLLLVLKACRDRHQILLKCILVKIEGPGFSILASVLFKLARSDVDSVGGKGRMACFFPTMAGLWCIEVDLHDMHRGVHVLC